MSGRKYVSMLKRLKRLKGRKYASLRRKASRARKTLINRRRPRARNGKRKYDVKHLLSKMPKAYRDMLAQVTRTAKGRAALKRYRAFTGLPFPPEIKLVSLPGPKNKTTVLVGMGKSPALYVADGDKRSGAKGRKVRQKGLLATDASGRRMMILSGRGSKDSRQKLKYLGRVPRTDYIMTPAEEKAGSKKAHKWWVHEQGESGGNWPKAYRDQAGNVIYAKGTYRVGEWIRD